MPSSSMEEAGTTATLRASVDAVFFADYGNTAQLYRTLELRSIRRPLFLPRTLSYRAAHRARQRQRSPTPRTAIQRALNEGRKLVKPAPDPQFPRLRFRGVSGLDCAQLESSLGVGSAVLPVTIALYEQRFVTPGSSSSIPSSNTSSDDEEGTESGAGVVPRLRLLEAYELALPLLPVTAVPQRGPVCEVTFGQDVAKFARARGLRGAVLVMQVHQAAGWHPNLQLGRQAQEAGQQHQPPRRPDSAGANAGGGDGSRDVGAQSSPQAATSSGDGDQEEVREPQRKSARDDVSSSQERLDSPLLPPLPLRARPSARQGRLSPTASLHEHPRDAGAVGAMRIAALIGDEARLAAVAEAQTQAETQAAAVANAGGAGVKQESCFDSAGFGCKRPREARLLDADTYKQWARLRSHGRPHFTSRLRLHSTSRQSLLVEGVYEVLLQPTSSTAPELLSAEPALHFDLHWASASNVSTALDPGHADEAARSTKDAVTETSDKSDQSSAGSKRKRRQTNEDCGTSKHGKKEQQKRQKVITTQVHEGHGSSSLSRGRVAPAVPSTQVPQLPRSPSTTLYMHYLYNQSTQRQTVVRRDFCCPICSMSCACLDGLLMHFTCSHSRFRFRLTEDSRGHPHIHVQVRQPAKFAGPAVCLPVAEGTTTGGAGSLSGPGGDVQGNGDGGDDGQASIARTGGQAGDDGSGSESDSDTAQTRPFVFFRARRTAAPSSYARAAVCTASARMHTQRAKRRAILGHHGGATGEVDEEDEDDKDDHAVDLPIMAGVAGATEKKKRRRMRDACNLQEVPPLEPERQYFHSRSGMPLTRTEMLFDSDDEVDEEWVLQQSEKLLDEFEDVSLEEKEFMKMWNRHVHNYRIFADSNVPNACEVFASLHGPSIIAKQLRQNFLLHLFNLWDASLVSSRTITRCLSIVDGKFDHSNNAQAEEHLT